MFGKRLKKLRKEKDISQEELGKIANVSYRTIGYYEAEGRFPNDEEVLKRISEYFDVTVDYLLGYTDDRNIYKTVKDIPDEIREVGVSYLTLAKELNDESVDIDEVKDILKLIRKHKK